MKIRKTLRLGMLVLAAVSMLLTGCAGETQYEVASYQGQLKEGETKSGFNKELFYRNDKQTGSADPFVLDNTERDGYYYLYGTEGSLFCYRSKNMMDWEPVGNALDIYYFDSEGNISEQLQTAWSDVWAPEIIYDADTELYYMFFSASPVEDKDVVAGAGVTEGTPTRQLMVATSKYPYKDYKLVDFKDAASCGEENLHTFNETAGIMGANGEYVNAYPHYYTKYLFLEPEMYREFSIANGRTGAGGGTGGYITAIDPHPYVDEDGTKYLFWVDNLGEDRICGVKMINWLKPDWSTAKVLTYSLFYTVEDWQASSEGKTVEKVTYEQSDNTTNEGPVLIKHNGKYYLTFSVNKYTDSSYQLGQAIADSPLGDYRKLTEAEGGLLLSGGVAGSQELSGTGHHSFVTVGEQMYVVYHRHNDFVTAGAQRNHAIDEIKWITIKDKDGNDLEVMYSNGPTCTVQPRIEAYSDYKNIAEEAKVSGSEDASYLNDELLSIYKYANSEFMEYIKETTISETTTFTFDFEEARTVRAVMVYNSKMENTCFKNVAKIELLCEENGEEVTRYIENLEFSSEFYKSNDLDGSVYYNVPGASVYAEFDELNVKSVKVTVEVPKGQESVGISEVMILGK